VLEGVIRSDVYVVHGMAGFSSTGELWVFLPWCIEKGRCHRGRDWQEGVGPAVGCERQRKVLFFRGWVDWKRPGSILGIHLRKNQKHTGKFRRTGRGRFESFLKTWSMGRSKEAHILVKGRRPSGRDSKQRPLLKNCHRVQKG